MKILLPLLLFTTINANFLTDFFKKDVSPPGKSCTFDDRITLRNVRNNKLIKMQLANLRSKSLAHLRGFLSEAISFSPYDTFFNSSFNEEYNRIEYSEINRIEELVKICEVIVCRNGQCNLLIDQIDQEDTRQCIIPETTNPTINCANAPVLTVQDSKNNILNTIEVVDLKSKTLADLREILFQNRLLTVYGGFLSSHLDGRINKNTENIELACNIISCEDNQCTLLVTQESAPDIVSPPLESKSRSTPSCPTSGLLNVYDVQNNFRSTIEDSDIKFKTLAELRERLYTERLITYNGIFLRPDFDLKINPRDYSPVATRAEKTGMACDIISCNDNNCYVYIGHIRWTSEQANIDRFLRGISVEANGEWKQSVFKAAEFADNNYRPGVERLQGSSRYITSKTSSLSEHLRNKGGITNESFGGNSPISNDSATWRNQNIYVNVRRIINGLSIQLDIEKLKPTNNFVEDIFKITGSKGTDLQKAMDLTRLLNRYGWYIPVKYTMGSAIQKDGCIQRLSGNRANLFADKLKAELQASIEAGGEVNHDKLQEKGWSVVQYDELVPTVLLLRRDNDVALHEVIRIFRRVHFDSKLKSLQPNIDLNQYTNNIAWRITPVW